MWIKKLDKENKTITVAIPLTKGTEKTRIKRRSNFNEYGIPVPTKREMFTQACYVEWQIGYDVEINNTEKLERTTIKNSIFIGANDHEKTLYELSEYLAYFHKWNVVKKEDLLDIKGFLESLSERDFMDNPNNFSIERTHAVEKEFLGINFLYTQVKYPMLVHKFGNYEILTEIKITEKQYAIGVQPMIYFCLPITELASDSNIIGRCAETNETADFIINENNVNIFISMLKIFGILSKNHNKDIISIIDKIIEYGGN